MNISEKHLTVDGHIMWKIWVMWNGRKHCTGAVYIRNEIYVDLWRNGKYITCINQEEIEKSLSHAHNITIPQMLFTNRDNYLV